MKWSIKKIGTHTSFIIEKGDFNFKLYFWIISRIGPPRKTSRLQVWIMRLCGTRLLCFDCVTGTICEEETWLLRFPSWQWSDLANVLSSCVIKTWALFLSQRKIQIRNPNSKKYLPKKCLLCSQAGNEAFGQCSIELCHGLWTPYEGINQRYLKNWANVADKICFGHT